MGRRVSAARATAAAGPAMKPSSRYQALTSRPPFLRDPITSSITKENRKGPIALLGALFREDRMVLVPKLGSVRVSPRCPARASGTLDIHAFKKAVRDAELKAFDMSTFSRTWSGLSTWVTESRRAM
jgi:hypothetical protein